MKLFKKIAALVAVAACCFTMVTPVSAEAAVNTTEKCLRHFWIEENACYEYIEAISYVFPVYYDYDNDGYEEMISEVCTEVYYLYTYDKVCTKCSIVYPDQVADDPYVTHSEPKCPNNGVG